MPLAIVKEDTRVETTSHVFFLKANTPTELTESQYQDALQFGAQPASLADKLPEPEKPVGDTIKEIHAAIQTMLDEGQDFLTNTGVPKMSSLRETVPEATPELRDQVWE